MDEELHADYCSKRIHGDCCAKDCDCGNDELHARIRKQRAALEDIKRAVTPPQSELDRRIYSKCAEALAPAIDLSEAFDRRSQ